MSVGGFLEGLKNDIVVVHKKKRQNETKANFFVAFFLDKKRKKLEKL